MECNITQLTYLVKTSFKMGGGGGRGGCLQRGRVGLPKFNLGYGYFKKFMLSLFEA